MSIPNYSPVAEMAGELRSRASTETLVHRAGIASPKRTKWANGAVSGPIYSPIAPASNAIEYDNTSKGCSTENKGRNRK